jgi:hypothetical protein
VELIRGRVFVCENEESFSVENQDWKPEEALCCKNCSLKLSEERNKSAMKSISFFFFKSAIIPRNTCLSLNTHLLVNESISYGLFSHFEVQKPTRAMKWMKLYSHEPKVQTPWTKSAENHWSLQLSSSVENISLKFIKKLVSKNSQLIIYERERESNALNFNSIFRSAKQYFILSTFHNKFDSKKQQKIHELL